MGLTPPDDLPEAAVEVWQRMRDKLASRGSVDEEILRAWCCTVAEIRAAEAWVAEHGTTYTLRDDKGNVRSSGEAPRYRQLRELRADLIRLGAALGL